MARPDELPDLGERRRGGDDPLPDERVLADEHPLVVVERAGLGQDRVGDRHLAEVVQLARLPEHVELVPGEAQTLADGGDEIADAVQMVVQLGLALVERLEQCVGCLAGGGAAAGRLARVEALVGGPQGGLDRRQLAGATTPPYEAPTSKPSPRSESASTVRDRDRVDPFVAERGENAELVAAEPVGRPVRPDRLEQAVAEPSEQRVSGRVPERIVVELEAVEIADQDAEWPRRSRERQRAARGRRSACAGCRGR